MEHWYLVHTKPRRESQVAVQLNQRGFAVYLPLIWVSPVNQRASRQRAYFPGRLFTKVDLQSVDVAIIRWAPGIKSILEISDMFVPISDDFITELQKGLHRLRAVGSMSYDGTWRADFRPVTTGPFMGYEGIFNPRLPGSERVNILLACIEQDYWRQALPTRSTAVIRDDSASADSKQ